jgi:tRNA pseudouridine32 synthase/23S rRNA pseudouridine746 synthase
VSGPPGGRAAELLVPDGRWTLGPLLERQLALPPSAVRALLSRGAVSLGRRPCWRDDLRLVPGHTVTVAGAGFPDAPAAAVRRVLLEPGLLVVDKPKGLNVHPVREGDLHHVLGVVRAWPEAVGWSAEAPFVVSRLDRETDGVLPLPLEGGLAASLAAALAAGRAHKEYRAWVWGVPPEEGEISLPLARRGDRVVVAPSGQPSLTRFRRLRRERGGAEVVLWPVTGRTHQLRVHLAAIGHPLAGDLVYGGARRAPGEPVQLRCACVTLPDGRSLGDGWAVR